MIEIDGDVHFIGNAEENDARRTSVLENYGLSVVRFNNQDVLNTFTDVVREIELLCGQLSE